MQALPGGGQRTETRRGTYDVVVTDNGGVPSSTRVIITIKDGKVTITVCR